jgi:hypothetical protein
MKSYRFSPIINQEGLHEAIEYIHRKCSKLCKDIFGSYLPCAGNIGVFCHYEDEYEFLTRLREKLTEKTNNWNEKYYRLYEPIMILAQGEVPGATYTYLYIRKPDQHSEVGDVDFVLDKSNYDELKASLSGGKKSNGMEVLDRSELDLIKLSEPNTDVIAFIGKKDMTENVGLK